MGVRKAGSETRVNVKVIVEKVAVAIQVFVASVQRGTGERIA